jgi:hypothetical protein
MPHSRATGKLGGNFSNMREKIQNFQYVEFFSKKTKKIVGGKFFKI